MPGIKKAISKKKKPAKKPAGKMKPRKNSSYSKTMQKIKKKNK